MAVQAWFSIYQVVLLAPVVFVLRRSMRNPLPLLWRWSIPMIGLFLVVADFLYFYALDFEDSLISVVSIVRRSSVIVSFLDRKSTRLNSSHVRISYAVFCLK